MNVQLIDDDYNYRIAHPFGLVRTYKLVIGGVLHDISINKDKNYFTPLESYGYRLLSELFKLVFYKSFLYQNMTLN